MTTSPMIERLEFPSIVLELPAGRMAPPFASTISRIPAAERTALPRPPAERRADRFGEAEWEKVAAGVLAGFGGGIVTAFVLATVVH